jgi:hypothetical protein
VKFGRRDADRVEEQDARVAAVVDERRVGHVLVESGSSDLSMGDGWAASGVLIVD